MKIGVVRGAKAAYDAKLARNWLRGNWRVRGFLFDKFLATMTTLPSLSALSSTPNAIARARTDNVLRVSVVVAPTLSSRDTNILLPQDRALPRDLPVAVGKTNGSVFVVKLGNKYLMKFAADDNGGADVGQN